MPGEARGARERFGARASGAEGFALHADRRDRCLDTRMAQGLANGPGGPGFLLKALLRVLRCLIRARGIAAAARRALGQGGRRHGAPEMERLLLVSSDAVMIRHAPVIGLDQYRQGVVPDFARFRLSSEMQPRKSPLQIVYRQGAVRRNLDQHPADRGFGVRMPDRGQRRDTNALRLVGRAQVAHTPEDTLDARGLVGQSSGQPFCRPIAHGLGELHDPGKRPGLEFRGLCKIPQIVEQQIRRAVVGDLAEAGFGRLGEGVLCFVACIFGPEALTHRFVTLDQALERAGAGAGLQDATV